MNGYASLLEVVRPHFVPLSLCAARILPVTFLCPLLGGVALPMTVRLSLTLSLAGFLHLGGGVAAPEMASPLELGGAVLRELFLGVGLGLLAALPFDAARMGGKFVDLFRGSSAEAALPLAGTREAASGDFLHQLLVALAVTGGALPFVIGALARTFVLLPPGSTVPHQALASFAPALVLTAMAAGLAIGAPVAGCALLVDAALAVCARVAPQLHLGDAGTPVKILVGGATLYLGLGFIADRLLAGLEALPASLAMVLS